MLNYYFTNKAVEDLTDIWDYTFHKWSEQQADKYYIMLIDNCKLIAQDPIIGNVYDGVFDQLFGHRSGRHIIFYRIINDSKIEITRILHEKMDLKNRIIE